MKLLQRAFAKGGRMLLVALAFLAGGLVVPHIVEASVSSGERDAFLPLPPARILDTRFGPSPLPVGTKLGAGQTIDLVVGGQGGVTTTAAAAVLNITATNASSESHLTIWPTGQPKPNSSSLNFGPNDTIPNAVTVKLGTGGKVSIFNNAGALDVIGDVNGYYEDHNHDDRYDTKAQVDGKVANALAAANYVGTNQIVDGSIGFADVASNSLTLTKMNQLSRTKTSVAISVAANSCGPVALTGVDLLVASQSAIVRPVASLFTGASSLVPVVSTLNGVQAGTSSVNLVVMFCNPTGATISGTGSVTLTIL